jgi:hypothetical protein
LKRLNPISETFSGVSGRLSSKRFMMFFSFLVMIFMAIISTFYGTKVEQFIFDGFLYIVVGSLFSVASEQFATKFRKIDNSEYYEEINDIDIIHDEPKRKRRNG